MILIVYALRTPPRPIGGRRLANLLFCGRQILQNRGQELSKITPGGSRGHQKPCQEHQEQQVGSPGPSWAPILTLGGTIWALLGLKLELRGLILLPRWIVLGAPGLHFEGPGAPRGSILSILQQSCRIHENH